MENLKEQFPLDAFDGSVSKARLGASCLENSSMPFG